MNTFAAKHSTRFESVFKWRAELGHPDGGDDEDDDVSTTVVEENGKFNPLLLLLLGCMDFELQY